VRRTWDHAAVSLTFPSEIADAEALLALLRARDDVGAAAAAAERARRLLARALRDAGADGAIVEMVESAATPSGVPANLPLGPEVTQGDAVVRLAQGRLVDAIVAHLAAEDGLDLAEQNAEAVLPAGVRATALEVRQLAVTGQPVHDAVAFAGADGDLMADRFVCGRPRTPAHHRVTGAVAQARCPDCRSVRSSDGPFAPEVAPIGHIDPVATDDPGVDPAGDADLPATVDPMPPARRPPRDAASPRLLPGPRPAGPPRRVSFGERHRRVWALIVAIRLLVVLALVVAVFAGVVLGISGQLDLASILPR
jgi:hypothetical protein